MKYSNEYVFYFEWLKSAKERANIDYGFSDYNEESFSKRMIDDFTAVKYALNWMREFERNNDVVFVCVYVQKRFTDSFITILSMNE